MASVRACCSGHPINAETGAAALLLLFTLSKQWCLGLDANTTFILAQLVLDSQLFDDCRKKVVWLSFSPRSVCDCHACTHVACCFLVTVKCVKGLSSNSCAIVSSYPSPVASDFCCLSEDSFKALIFLKSLVNEVSTVYRRKIQLFENTLCI